MRSLSRHALICSMPTDNSNHAELRAINPTTSLLDHGGCICLVIQPSGSDGSLCVTSLPSLGSLPSHLVSLPGYVWVCDVLRV